MRNQILALCLVLLTQGGRSTISEFSAREDGLRKSLLQNYWRTVPPNTSTHVFAGIEVFDLDNVDLSLGTVGLGVLLHLSWQDTRLRWNPADWTYTSPDGTTQQLTQLYFAVAPRDKTQSEIYSPEFEVLDMHESLSDTLADEFAVVANNGSISWTRGGHIRAACDVEALDFPFMSPECSISLGAFAEPLQIYPDVIRKWEAKLLPAWEHYLFAPCAELRMTGTNVSSKPFSATSVDCVATGEKTMKLSVTITWSTGPY